MDDKLARWLALYTLCLGDLMIVLDTTIVNVALPSIRTDLGFSETSLAWVVNAYVLTFAPEAIYDFYERQPGYWSLSPDTDQAVGGLIMALEQSIVMGVALVFLFVRALGESDREDERAERYAS